MSAASTAAAGVVDIDELARLFRVTEKAIRDWIKSGLPVHAKGKRGGGKERDKTLFILVDAVEWYFNENYESLELDRQRTRLASEQAQKVAIENAIRIGDVGELAIWEGEISKLFEEIRAAFLALPTKEAPRLDGDVNERKDRLETAIHDILRKLAIFKPSQPAKADAGSAVEADDDIEPAVKANGKRVGRQIPKTIERKQRRARRMEN